MTERLAVRATNGNGNGNGIKGTSQWIVGFVASAAAIVGALISFFISTSSLNVQVVNLTARTNSLEAGINSLQDRNAQQRADSLVTAAKLVEIETQFCASDIVRNLMHANDLRVIAILWHKAHPTETYPIDNAFYPQICNRSIQPAATDRGR